MDILDNQIFTHEEVFKQLKTLTEMVGTCLERIEDLDNKIDWLETCVANLQNNGN